MSSFKIIIANERIGNALAKVAKFEGVADASDVEEIEKEMEKVLEEENGEFDLVIEGSTLEFVNSTFIGYLIRWFEILQKKGKKVLLANFRANVLDSFSTLGLLTLMPHFDSLEEAEEALL